MGSTTAPTGLPYPVGTDRVMDGDDAIKALADTLDPPWIALPLQSGLTAVAGRTAPGYRRIGTNKVELRGAISKASAFVETETIATLPVGYRPVGVVWLPVPASRVSATAPGIVWRLMIQTTGVMQLNIDPTSPGSIVSLEGGSFWIQ